MTHAHGLEPHRGHDLPARLFGDAFGEPLRVVKVAAESLTDRLRTIKSELVPELERSETAPERDAPVAVLDGLPAGGRL